MSYELPPGFRFHPTDEELIVFYLCNQAASQPCPAPIIPQLNVYRFEPWDLPGKSAGLGEREWYFFTPRGRKYPNGMRPNRATATGYWKATGTDKPIHSGSARVGVKKSLVFYQGRPPKGRKTDWIMHEYRLCGSPPVSSPFKAGGLEDEWVLCRIYQKRQQKRDVEKAPEFPRSCSLACLMEPDYAQLFSDSAAATVDDLFACCGNAGGWDLLKA